jgi:uncharacterized membrane protein
VDEASGLPEGEKLFESRSSAALYLCAAAGIWNGLGVLLMSAGLDSDGSRFGPSSTLGAVAIFIGFAVAFVGMAIVCFMAWSRSEGIASGEFSLRMRMVWMGGVADAARYVGLARWAVITYIVIPIVLIAGGTTLLVFRP